MIAACCSSRRSDRHISVWHDRCPSPLLANVYLHYMFDLWADHWRRHVAVGDAVIVRYADNIVVGFQYEADARRYCDDMGYVRYQLDCGSTSRLAERRMTCLH